MLLPGATEADDLERCEVMLNLIRKMWLNAVIKLLQDDLELIRQANLKTRTGIPEAELRERLQRFEERKTRAMRKFERGEA